jgi:hypothetical protein
MTDEVPGEEVDRDPPAARRWKAVAAAAVVCALAIGIATVIALLQSGRVDDLEAERDDARSVREVAAAFGEAYLSYDSSDVDASSAAVLALASEAFAVDFSETRVPGIEQLFADIDTTTVASTSAVYLGDVGDGRATALVVVDVDATSDATGPQTLHDLSFVLELIEVDGDWKVDSVAPAPTPDVTSAGEG